jgi:hypothetical protein
VLAVSLERSRQKWLNEGIFEKYWTKPSKKKNQADIHNPPKDTMLKLGTCTITIEPHSFEATLYTVREPQVTFLPPMGLTPPRSLLPQYGAPAAQHPSLYSNLKPPTQPATQTSSPAFANHPSSSLSKENSVQQRPAINPRTTPTSTNATPIPGQGTIGPINSMTAQAPPQASKTTPPSPDPVIQMLATKAATDHNLKALMRVVASGKASPAELRIFQGHIDELNAILQAKSQANRPLAPSPLTSSASNLQRTPSTDPYSAPVGQHIPRDVNGNGFTLPPPTAPVKAEPVPNYYTESLPAVRPKVQPPMKPDITAVVLEFSAGSGDRFLFPKHSVLEYLPGGTRVIASFLVVRKGSLSDAGAYDPKLDYYQPVTINLSTPHARLLEPLARVVAPLEEVRKHMDGIMDRMPRAREVHLALRLPRAADDIMEDTEEHMGANEVDGVQAIYAPPSAVVPIRKPSKMMSGLVKAN